MMELTIDREFEELCPPLSADEARLLEESIERDGCRDAIITWANHDDTILDGHNRYRFCLKHNRTFKIKALAFETRQDVVNWIVRNQIGRRNLNEAQRAMLAARMVNGSEFANLQIATANAATTCNVSPRSIASARKVVESGSTDLQRVVSAGEVAVSAAAVVAELPKAEQRKVVKQGPKAVAEKAKEIKAEKASAKISGGTTFNVEELTNESKDAFGKDVDGELSTVFELCEEFDDQRNKLTSIKSWMTQRQKHVGAAILADAMQRIKSDIDNADAELRYAKPYCVCVYCKNKAPKCLNCNACKGLGWITEPIFKQAPEEMRVKAKG